jgi:DNA-binding SARP family transcriptional activator
MSLALHLLGRPSITGPAGPAYQFRSRKSWALLTYLVLSERPPSRSRLASMLFAQAEDPVRALRWCLSEIRRGLGDAAVLDGDPVVLTLPPGTVIDVDVVQRGTWADAVALPGLGAELLEGMALRDAPAFETWLLSAQHHLSAVSAAVLHEAALGSICARSLDAALGFAVRAAELSPLDENHQALLIRLYRMGGDEVAAAKQLRAATVNFQRVLGVTPGAAVAAMTVPRQDRREVAYRQRC